MIICKDNNSSMEIEVRSKTAPWRWSLLLCVIILNIFLPSLVLSYGTLLIHSVEDEVAPWPVLVIPTIFMFVYCWTQCWCRDAADSWGGGNGHRVMAIIGLFLVFAGLITCTFTSYTLHTLFYGVFGGLGSSLISAQVDAVIFDAYDTRLGIVRGLCLAGQAVGQFTFPHLISSIIDSYGISLAYFLLSGIIIQTLPAMLFLKIDDNFKRPKSYSRYSDISKAYVYFKSDISDSYINEVQLHNLSKKCWKSPSDDNIHREIDIDEDDFNNISTITPPPSPEEKRKNMFGVEILPDILEESEHSDVSESENSKDKYKNHFKARLSATIRRLSTLSDNLDGYITKQIRKDSLSDMNENNEYTEIEVTYENVSPKTDIDNEKIFSSVTFRWNSLWFNMKRRVCMPSYKLYRIKRRMLYFIYSFNDTFIKPLTRSLSCWKFYPALLLCFSKLSLTAISLPLLPLMSLQFFPRISSTEINFLMSLHAFTWFCFLLSTPWLANTPKRNFKFILVFGLLVSTIACFLISRSENDDAFSIGCVVAGFGFGTITSCWETTVQDFIGARKWPKIHSSLETLSGTCLAVFVICLIYVYPNDLKMWFILLGYILSCITLIWLIIAFVMFCRTSIRNFVLGKT